MPWRLASPGHQQPWYWFCRIGRSLSYSRRNFTTCVWLMWRNDIKCEYMFMFPLKNLARKGLTHWGRVTHICVGKLTIIGSDNGLSPERRQAIIWTNAGILLIGPLRTNFNEILIEIQTFSLKKIRLKMSSAKCCSFRVGLNVLRQND